MGAPKDPREIILDDPQAPKTPTPAKVRVVPPNQKLLFSAQVQSRYEELRNEVTPEKRAIYWEGVDWRKKGLPSTVFDVFDHPNEDGCVGYAMAAALRINLAIHGRNERKGDPGPLNPYFVYGMARERDFQLRAPRAGLLQEALSIVNLYGVPPKNVGPQSLHDVSPPFTPQATDYLPVSQKHKIQSWVDLGNFLGDWSAWLHFQGPIVVQMNIDRALFSEQVVTKANPVVDYRPGLAVDAELTTKYAGHVVVVVGYVPVGAGRHEDSFIVMNSYGEDWGEKGFAYIKVDKAKLCFINGYGLLFREHLAYGFEEKCRGQKKGIDKAAYGTALEPGAAE